MILTLLCTSVMGSDASPETQLRRDLGDTPSPHGHQKEDASPNFLVIRGQQAAERELREVEAKLQNTNVERTLLLSEKQLLEVTLLEANRQAIMLETELVATKTAQKQASEERTRLSEQNRVLVKRYALLKQAAEMTDKEVEEFATKFDRLASDLATGGIEIFGVERNDEGEVIRDAAGQPKQFDRVRQLSDFLQTLSVNSSERDIRESLKNPQTRKKAADQIFAIATAIQQQISS